MDSSRANSVSPSSLSTTPDCAELQDLEAALDRKRWRVHGENYEKVEERLRGVCLQVQETIAHLIGAMRDLENWQATAAKACQLPTNSLAKITVITSQMVRSRSVLTGQLGSLQDVCRCFFPSTMLLEITGQRELQARAEVEIEKWAQLAFNGQQKAKKDFKTLYAALRWYRLSSQLVERFTQEGHQTRVRKLRARIAENERRIRGLRGQLAWEKKRADRAFGALHINRKLARSLAPGDFQQEAQKSVNANKGWASARGADIRTPREKGSVTSRSVGGKRPSTRGGGAQNGRELKSIERKLARESGMLNRESGVDRTLEGEEDPPPAFADGRASQMESGSKVVTNADFAAAVASLTARIKEATSIRTGGFDLTLPLPENAGGSNQGLAGASIPGFLGSVDVSRGGVFGSVISTPSVSASISQETADAHNLEASHPLLNGPVRSTSPVLNAEKGGVFIPSLNLWKKGVSRIMKESRTGRSSEGSPKGDALPGSDSQRSPKNESSAASESRPSANTASRFVERTSSSVTSLVSPRATSGGPFETKATLPKIVSTQTEKNSQGTPPDRSKESPPQENAAIASSNNKLPPLTQTENLRASASIVPRLPLGSLTSSRTDPDGLAVTERLARAMGIEIKPSSGKETGRETAVQSPRKDVELDKAAAQTSGKDSVLASKPKSQEAGYSTGHKESSSKRSGDQIHFPTGHLEIKTEGIPSSALPAVEWPGSLTERGTASTSAHGDENQESFSKREVLSMRLEQGRQMQHLQTLYEERIQGLHDFYEKLLQTQLPAVLAQLTGNFSERGHGGLRSLESPLAEPGSKRTSGMTTGPKEQPPSLVTTSLDSSRGKAAMSKAVTLSKLTRSMRATTIR